MQAQATDVLFTQEPRRYHFKGKAYRSVTDRIKAVGFGPDFSMVDPITLQRACDRGNAVDLALTYHYEGDLDPKSIDKQIVGYLDGAFMFDRECPGKVVAVHPRVADEGLGVAGTLDIVRFIRGMRSVVDWKTGVDNPLQTWMYQILWNLAHPKALCYHRYGLRLKANGKYVLQEHNDPDDGPAAMAIIRNDKAAIERWRPKYGHKLITGEN